MESKIASYRINVLDQPCEINGRQFEKTVEIKTVIEEELTNLKKYGWVSKESIYKQIESGEAIDLKNCYVLDFSLSEYRRLNDLENTYYVKINDFEAKDCFFDSELHVDFSYSLFEGRVNFNNAIFSNGGVSFYYAHFLSKSHIDFRKSVFGKGSVNFQYVKFSDQNVLFSFAKFYGGTVSFVNADFGEGSVLFNSAHFHHSKVKFHFAKFGTGGVEFQKSKFGNQTVDFRRVEFGKGKVDFRRTSFGEGYVTFDESEMKGGKFKFSSARFGNNDISFERFDFGEAEVLFENVDFGRGALSFFNSSIKYISFKRSKIDVFINFCVKKAEIVDFSETVLRDIIDMKTDSENVKIKTMYLTGMRNLGRFIFDWDDNKLKDLIKSQPDTSLEEKAEQFTIIKENFNLSGIYEQEDLAYIQFKRFEYRTDYQKILNNGWRDYWKLPGMLFKWIVFDKMGLYATSPLRVLLSMLVVYILFSLTYFMMPIIGVGDIVNSVGAIDGLTYIQTCFYHSAITFLTIGYGDYYPTEMSRGISIVEGWMGLFLMSYFTVAFVRKILR
jgi:hypothetical protein